MRFDRISLPVILAVAFAAILLATIAAGTRIARHYESLFYAAKTEQVQRLLDSEIAVDLWRDQFALATEVSRAVAVTDDFARLAATRDTDQVRELLDDASRRVTVSRGPLTIAGITIYDSELRPLAERGYATPAASPPVDPIQPARRDGVAQFVWLHNGQPRVTVVVASGRQPAVYLGVHVDPLPALEAIDTLAGLAIRVVGKSDRRLLFARPTVPVAPDAITRQGVLRLHGPHGEHLADIEVNEDVSVLERGLDRTRRDWLIIVIVIVGGVAAASLVVVHHFLARVRRREQDDEQRFRDYAETASDWFWETGPDHRFTYLSERARAFGIDPSKRLGLSRVAFAADIDQEPDKWREHIATLARHEPFRDFVYRRPGSDGIARTVSVSGKPVFAPDGEFLGYRGSSRDITAQVATEQQLRQAKIEAESLRDDALGADRAKSEFLATMSHELRTPLNAVIGFSEAMLHEVMGPIANPRYREYVLDIHNSGQHLLELINSILDLSKLQARSMTLNEDVVDVGAVIDACVRLVRERARNAEIELRTEFPGKSPGELLLVRADELRLKQILLNPLSNAMKFTPAGGSVTISAARLPDGRTELRVADTGIGLNEAEIAIALQPFRQIDNSLGRTHQGTGLGLPLTKALVELHGGELALASEPGRGTQVTILLPAERAVAVEDVLRVEGE